MRWVWYVAEIIDVTCFGILSPQKITVTSVLYMLQNSYQAYFKANEMLFYSHITHNQSNFDFTIT
jgi:hypothetical protein